MSETATATIDEITPEEQIRRLDAMMDAIAEQRAESILTLEDLFGEPKPLGDAWPRGEAAYLSPKMKELKAIFRGMEEIESRIVNGLEDAFQIMDDYSILAGKLIVVPVGDNTWRRAMPDEIQERFTLDELKALVMQMLRKDGFEGSETGGTEGNA